VAGIGPITAVDIAVKADSDSVNPEEERGGLDNDNRKVRIYIY
jgi:hypothetical protein